MSLPNNLGEMRGKWAGPNQLCPDPQQPADEAARTTLAELAAQYKRQI